MDWAPKYQSVCAAEIRVGDTILGLGAAVERVTHEIRVGSGGTETSYEPRDVVSVYRPPRIKVGMLTSGRWRVAFEHPRGEGVTFTCQRHAECYAEKLRNDPALLAEALGE